jgi:integrase
MSLDSSHCSSLWRAPAFGRVKPWPSNGRNLDLSANTLHVSRALSLGEVGPTKTGESCDVHLSPDVVGTLGRHRIDCERETLRRGWSTVPACVFPPTAGTPYDPANVVKVMKRALRKAELPGFRLYDLRHRFATQLLNHGVPINYVAAQPGRRAPGPHR